MSTLNVVQRGACLALMAVALLTLTACGFSLRGPVVLPASMQNVYVQGGSLDLNRELKGLLASSANVVDEASEAQVILHIESEKQTRRTLSTDTRGKVREMELYYSVVYSVRKAGDGGELLLEHESIKLLRDYLNDESDVLGKSNEATVLYEDMQRDAAQRILRRIQSLH